MQSLDWNIRLNTFQCSTERLFQLSLVWWEVATIIPMWILWCVGMKYVGKTKHTKHKMFPIHSEKKHNIQVFYNQQQQHSETAILCALFSAGRSVQICLHTLHIKKHSLEYQDVHNIDREDRWFERRVKEDIYVKLVKPWTGGGGNTPFSLCLHAALTSIQTKPHPSYPSLMVMWMWLSPANTHAQLHLRPTHTHPTVGRTGARTIHPHPEGADIENWLNMQVIFCCYKFICLQEHTFTH